MKKVKGARKKEILKAAQILFAERGFDGTSLDAIIEASNTSKGTLYHYFSSKEDLYTVVLESMLETLWTKLDIAQLAQSTREQFWESIAMWWKRTAEHMLTDQVHMRLWKDFQENMRSFNDAGPTQRLRQRSLAVGSKLAEIGQEIGCIRNDLTPLQCATLIETLDVVLDDWFLTAADDKGSEQAFTEQKPISLGLVWRVLVPPEQLKHMPQGMA